MNKLIVSSLSAGALALSAHGQDPLMQRSRHQFGIGIPTWLNAKAGFTARRATNPGAAPGAPATLADGRVDRFYDDGFNRVNAAGNPALGPGGTPLTSFYGYQNNAQFANVPGAGTLSLHSATLNGGSYHEDLNNQPLPGVETFYRYDWKRGKNWSLDWELAAGYQNFHWRENGTPNATINLLTDTYALNGVALPAAPFSGPFTPVPGSPSIGSTPTRTEITAPATVTGFREIELHAIQVRLAPALNWHPNHKWSIGLQGGLTMGVGFSNLDYNENITTTVAGVPTITQAGRSSDQHFWAGWFSALRLSHRFNQRWRAHADIRHIYTRTLNHTGATRSAKIDLSEGFGVSAVISHSFR